MKIKTRITVELSQEEYDNLPINKGRIFIDGNEYLISYLECRSSWPVNSAIHLEIEKVRFIK